MIDFVRQLHYFYIMGIKTSLKNIYRAKDCTDINDVEFAIKEMNKLCLKYPRKVSAQRRLSSLWKRKIYLQRR